MWVAPIHWEIEFVSAIWQKLRAGQCDHRTASELFGHLGEIVARSFDVDPRDVLELAITAQHSPYDCAFVVLARSLKVRITTYDRRVLELFTDVARTPLQLIHEMESRS